MSTESRMCVQQPDSSVGTKQHHETGHAWEHSNCGCHTALGEEHYSNHLGLVCAFSKDTKMHAYQGQVARSNRCMPMSVPDLAYCNATVVL